jgi:hypothetical protein
MDGKWMKKFEIILFRKPDRPEAPRGIKNNPWILGGGF